MTNSPFSIPEANALRKLNEGMTKFVTGEGPFPSKGDTPCSLRIQNVFHNI